LLADRLGQQRTELLVGHDRPDLDLEHVVPVERPLRHQQRIVGLGDGDARDGADLVPATDQLDPGRRHAAALQEPFSRGIAHRGAAPPTDREQHGSFLEGTGEESVRARCQQASRRDEPGRLIPCLWVDDDAEAACVAPAFRK